MTRNNNYEPILTLAEKVLARMRAELERPVQSLDATAINQQVRNLEILKTLIGTAKIGELPWKNETEVSEAVKLVMLLIQGEALSAHHIQRKLSQ